MGNHLGLGSRTRNENRTTVLPGDRNISNHGPSAQTRAVATSSTDRAPNLTNYHVPPRSGSTAQTGRRNTTPNIPGGSTNSRGNRSANS